MGISYPKVCIKNKKRPTRRVICLECRRNCTFAGKKRSFKEKLVGVSSKKEREIMVAEGEYKIKKRYNPDGGSPRFYIYSRYPKPAKKGLSFRRYALAGPFYSRVEAIAGAKALNMKSNEFVVRLML